MKMALSTLIILIAFVAAANAQTKKSYIIAENSPAFCEGGRFLIQARKAGLFITCEDPTRTVLTLYGKASVIGVTVGTPSLEDIAEAGE